MTAPSQALIRWSDGHRFGIVSWLGDQWWIGGEYVFRQGGTMIVPGLILKAATLSQALLWAVALEIDERGPTPTGDLLCRACGGWGEMLTVPSAYPFPDIADDARPAGCTITYTPHAISRAPLTCSVWRYRCPCDGPARPHTASLHRTVASMAAMRSPIVTDWPDRWLVNLDAMEAAGWSDVVLPGEDRVTPAWVCQWWRAFAEWGMAGKDPDPEPLARTLRDLDAERARRRDAERDAERARMQALVESTLRPHFDRDPGIDFTVDGIERLMGLVGVPPQIAAGMPPSLESAIRSVPGVTAVEIRRNYTMTPDPVWAQPMWVEAVVDGGNTRAIAERIRDVLPASIGTVGNTAVDVPGFGTFDTVRFSRRPGNEDRMHTWPLPLQGSLGVDTVLQPRIRATAPTRYEPISWRTTETLPVRLGFGVRSAAVGVTDGVDFAWSALTAVLPWAEIASADWYVTAIGSETGVDWRVILTDDASGQRLVIECYRTGDEATNAWLVERT